MASIAGFVIGNALGGARVGIVASMMPSPLIGAVIAQALVDGEDDSGDKPEWRLIKQEDSGLQTNRTWLEALLKGGELGEQDQQRVRRLVERLKADEKRLRKAKARWAKDVDASGG